MMDLNNNKLLPLQLFGETDSVKTIAIKSRLTVLANGGVTPIQAAADFDAWQVHEANRRLKTFMQRVGRDPEVVTTSIQRKKHEELTASAQSVLTLKATLTNVLKALPGFALPFLHFIPSRTSSLSFWRLYEPCHPKSYRIRHLFGVFMMVALESSAYRTIQVGTR